MSSNDDTAAARQLLDLINASWIAQACYVAARLGIAELLAAPTRARPMSWRRPPQPMRRRCDDC